MIVDFVIEFKLIIIIVVFAIGLGSIIISAIFHFCCLKKPSEKLVKSSTPVSSSKYSKTENYTRNKNRKRVVKVERKDMGVNLNQPNDYYVVLIEKD